VTWEKALLLSGVPFTMINYQLKYLDGTPYNELGRVEKIYRQHIFQVGSRYRVENQIEEFQKIFRMRRTTNFSSVFEKSGNIESNIGHICLWYRNPTPTGSTLVLLLGQNCSLPFSLRSLDIPALLTSWQKH
jgi:hypothetical protein